MRGKELEALIRLLNQYTKEYSSAAADNLLEEINEHPRRSRAGRKPKYDDTVKARIIGEYSNGKSMRQIQRLTHCSLGYIHSVINDDGGQDTAGG